MGWWWDHFISLNSFWMLESHVDGTPGRSRRQRRLRKHPTTRLCVKCKRSTFSQSWEPQIPAILEIQHWKKYGIAVHPISPYRPQHPQLITQASVRTFQGIWDGFRVQKFLFTNAHGDGIEGIPGPWLRASPARAHADDKFSEKTYRKKATSL